jgi:hypothetical protein
MLTASSSLDGDGGDGEGEDADAAAASGSEATSSLHFFARVATMVILAARAARATRAGATARVAVAAAVVVVVALFRGAMDAIARGVAAPARVMTLAARACIVSGGVEVPTSRGGRLTRHARGIEWNRGSEVRERSTQTFFTRPSGSTFDRVPFQRTDEHFFVTITRAPTTRTVPHGRV